MIGFQPSYDEYLVGSKFLTAEPGPHPSDRYKQTLLVNNLHEIIQVDDHLVTTIDREGVQSQWRRHWANPLMPTHPTRSRMAWFEPLPAGLFEEMRLFADLLMLDRRRSDGRPLLLLVDRVDEAGAHCRVVHPSTVGGERYRYGSAKDLPGVTTGSVFIIDQPVIISTCAVDALPAAQDLICMSSFVMQPTSDPIIKSGQITKIASDMDAAAVGRWYPTERSQAGQLRCSPVLPHGLWSDLEFEIERAMAAAKPSIALLAAVHCNKRDPEDVHHSVLQSMGTTFFDVDSLDDHFYGTDVGEGLWVAFNAAWVSNGDDGAEIECDFRRATLSDLDTFCVSTAEIDDHVADLHQVETMPGEAARLLSLSAPDDP